MQKLSPAFNQKVLSYSPEKKITTFAIIATFVFVPASCISLHRNFFFFVFGKMISLKNTTATQWEKEYQHGDIK